VTSTILCIYFNTKCHDHCLEIKLKYMHNIVCIVLTGSVLRARRVTYQFVVEFYSLLMV